MKIKRLTVKSNKLKEQLRFYKNQLGFEVSEYDEKCFVVQAGYSQLCFEYSKEFQPYHIAFHIPDEEEEKALRWIESEKPVLKDSTEKIIDFNNWNAKSVYFYDQEQNVMEFISRRDFNHKNSALFNAQSVVGIAEIGLAVEKIETIHDQLEELGLKKYDGNLDSFCAIGDDEGLIICVDQNKKTWYPTSDDAMPAAFRLEFEHQDKQYHLEYNGKTIQISEK